MKLPFSHDKWINVTVFLRILLCLPCRCLARRVALLVSPRAGARVISEKHFAVNCSQAVGSGGIFLYWYNLSAMRALLPSACCVQNDM